MVPLSVLDLVTVREGTGVGDALAASIESARTAEAAGYKRYWVAEHHGMEGVAGGATAVVLAAIGNATRTIRVGSGGIMLPNHSPYAIAEQFGTLAALFPGRIDLGLGRAPGADGRVGQMLRRDLRQAAEQFPQDVLELRALFAGDPEVPLPASPGRGAEVEMWMLGSSLFGASLAAALGLPYAFASHFAPDHLDAALALYRERFRPSATLDRPHVMAAMMVVCAQNDAEAQTLASSQEQGFVALRSGTPGKMKPPVEGYRASLPPQFQAMFTHLDQARAVGSPQTVRERIEAFVARTGADEIILSGATFDPAAQYRSLALTAEAFGLNMRQ
ncbi:MAG: LLM class flavin-dependent oxidoreductase [Novosphingobium sp.]